MAFVVLVPGSGDGARTYRDVTPLLPAGLTPVPFDMEDVGPDDLPAGFVWQQHLDRLHALVRSLDDDIFLIGLSAGATLGLAYVASYPTGLTALALVEPAYSYLPLTSIEQAFYAELDRVLHLPPSAQQSAFRQLLLDDDVAPPPENPAWSAGYLSAPAAPDTPLARLPKGMHEHSVRHDYLDVFLGPIYLAIGGRSNPMWRTQAKQIARQHSATRIELFEQRHHLDTPLHREVDRFVSSVLDTWGISTD